MKFNSKEVKQLRLEKGLSQQDVANAVGVTQSAYRYYETGERNPKHDTAVKIYEFLHSNIEAIEIEDPPAFKPGELKRARQAQNLDQYQVAELLGISQPMYNYWENGTKAVSYKKIDKLREVLKIGPVQSNLIPYYPNVNASAGMAFLADNSNLVTEMINIPNVDAQAFINVFGDSMYPKYCSGEIIGVKEVDKDYVMYGQAYVVQLKNGEAYLKYIKAGKDDNHWLLASENKQYEGKEFHLSKIDKVFIIKAVISKTTL